MESTTFYSDEYDEDNFVSEILSFGFVDENGEVTEVSQYELDSIDDQIDKFDPEDSIYLVVGLVDSVTGDDENWNVQAFLSHQTATEFVAALTSWVEQHPTFDWCPFDIQYVTGATYEIEEIPFQRT